MINPRFSFTISLVLSLALLYNTHADTSPTDGLVNYETPHVHPIDLTPDGQTLLAVNTAAHRLEVFDVTSGIPVLTTSIPVGIDPVSVRARSNTEAWVVNHISDSVSVVNLLTNAVVATLLTSNEPADVVFAGVPERAFVSCSEANLVEVFDPSNLTQPPQEIAISGEDPRALAVSPDGATVYLAIFESGNATTAVSGGGSVNANSVTSRPEGPYAGQLPIPNDGTSFNPPINSALPTPPNTAIIVRKDAGNRWMDDNNGDWSIFVNGGLAGLTNRVAGWDMPDRDVAIIDAQTLSVTYQTRLMNLVMAIGVNPVSGNVSVVGTEALNEVRFEPNLNGVFLRVNAAHFSPGGSADIDDLNPHLDYGTSTVGTTLRNQSIGDPRGIAWHANGQQAFVTGMGSDNVVVIDGAGNRLGHFPVGEGPTGIVLDAAAGHGFVMNKFAGSISVIDLNTQQQTAEVAFEDPTPQVIKEGRPFLYNTHLTSGLGHVSCASCHVDARTDRLSWDLGNPSGDLDTVLNASNSTGDTSGTTTVHPMKGPMLTQSLQDIMGFSTLHWRGDREDLGEFNPAFVSLMGAPAEISNEDMTKFGDFLDTIHLPPNPYRNIDNTRPATVTLPSGFVATTSSFNALRGTNSRSNNCMQCHMNGEQRNDASNRELAQAFAAPAWAPLYDRLGFWPSLQNGSTTGFGFFHDGADDIHGAARTNTAENQTDMLAELMTLEGPGGPLTGAERRQDAHAGVGQQVTLLGSVSANTANRLNSLVSIANNSSHAELVAHGRVNGVTRGYLLTSGDSFQADRQGETETVSSLTALAQAGNPLTFTMVTNGMGTRLGIDEDLDGILNFDENLPPIVENPGDQTNSVGSTVSLAVNASDPEGQPLSYVATGLPPGLDIDANTGVITGDLAANSLGIYQVTVLASDGQGSTSVSFTWFVPDASGNFPPSLSSIPNQSNLEGDSVSVSVSVANVDNDPLTFSAQFLPNGILIEPTTGTMSGTLADGSAGVFQVQVTVSDGQASDTESFVWVVRGVVFDDDFEVSSGWVTNPDGTDTATTGQWEIGVPEETIFNGAVMPIGNAASGSQALVTEVAAGTSVGSFDVDGGVTSVRSPAFTLPATTPITLSLSYYFAHLDNATTDDFFRITLEGETASTTLLEERAAPSVRAAQWTPWSATLDAFAGETVTLLIEAADAGTASLIEAGVDALSIIGAPPNQAPVLEALEDLANLVGDTVDFQVNASDANGDTLSFQATGLPPGLGISASGLISGTLTEAGEFTVSINVSDGADSTNETFVWTVTEDNPAEIDQLSNFNAPALVQQGQNVTATVDYESTQAHELWIWLQDSNTNWRTVASDNITLNPGIGTHSFDLQVASDARVGDGYIWVVRLMPAGWTGVADTLDALYLQGTVEAGGGGGDPTTNEIGNVDLPTDVLTPSTVTLDVPYEVTERRELAVWLHDSENGWFTIGQAFTTVERGTGTHSFEIPILSGARVGSGYIWAVRLFPLGWSSAADALDNVYGAATVAQNTGGGATQNILTSVDAPSTVQVAGVATVTVDYEATERRDLGIWLHDSTDNWRTIGTGLVKVDPGFGTEVFNIGIVGDARLGDGYVWAVRLLPEGWTSGNDALDQFFAPATVEEQDTSLVNYAVLPQASATQSSVFGSVYGSRLARDGNTDGDWRNRSVTHTELDVNAWWEVDLGSVKTIDHVLLWNRTDCCGERLVPYYVLVSDVPFVSTDLDTARAQAGVTEAFFDQEPSPTQRVDLNRSGRFVRIQLAGSNYLSLAEVEVYGPNEGPVNGVTYSYFEGTWDQVPDFDALIPRATGTVADLTLDVREREDFYAIRYRACLNVPADGTYTLYTQSDEGSRLLLNDQLVVNNDGVHTVQEASGTVTLTAGMHPMEVQYFDREGAQELTLLWEGPGLAKQVIPSTALSVNETGVSPGFHHLRQQVAVEENADGDLLDLIAENALGMNPYEGHMTSVGLQVGTMPDGYGIEVWYDRPARLSEFVYTLEFSTNARDWIEGPIPDIITESFGWERVRYPDLQNADPGIRDRGFVRLRIHHHGWNQTSTTPICGWQRTSLTEGYQTHGLGLTQPPVYASVVDAVAGTMLTTTSGGLRDALGQSSGIAGGGNLSTPFYLEFTNGELAGHRLDVDPSISTDQVVAFDWSSPHNTLPEISNNALDSSFVIRPHWTLGESYPIERFQGGRDIGRADQLQFFENGQFQSYFLLDAGGFHHWTSVADITLADRSTTIVPPGKGCFIRIQGAPAEALPALVNTGHLRTTPFIQPLAAGHQLLASPTALDLSPAQSGLDTDFVTGGLDPAETDQIQLWLGAGEGYTSYFRLDNGDAFRFWTGVEDVNLTDVNATPILQGNRAFFYRAMQSVPFYRVPGME